MLAEPTTTDAPEPWRFCVDYPDGAVWWDDAAVARWVEHIAWALRLLGVVDSGLHVVADHGASPISMLGSSLTMPIDQGWAERMGSGFLCLDASHPRLSIVPDLLGMLPMSTLIVRGSVLVPLMDICRRQGVVLDTAGIRVVVTLDAAPAPNQVVPGFDYLIVAEAALVIAPVCRACGHAHLRHDWYEWTDGEVHNRAQPGLASWSAPGVHPPTRGSCRERPRDLALAIPGLTGRAE